MLRIAAVALVAMATFDLFFLDGKFVRTVEAMALSQAHFIIR
jgi:hypothetical protein